MTPAVTLWTGLPRPARSGWKESYGERFGKWEPPAHPLYPHRLPIPLDTLPPHLSPVIPRPAHSPQVLPQSGWQGARVRQ